MKAIIGLLFLFVVVFSDKKPMINVHTMDEMLPQYKKRLLKCILENDKISESLKKYATENLENDLNKPLNFLQFKSALEDMTIIRKCRKDLFVIDRQAKRAAPQVKIVEKAELKVQ